MKGERERHSEATGHCVWEVETARPDKEDVVTDPNAV